MAILGYCLVLGHCGLVLKSLCLPILCAAFLNLLYNFRNGKITFLGRIKDVHLTLYFLILFLLLVSLNHHSKTNYHGRRSNYSQRLLSHNVNSENNSPLFLHYFLHILIVFVYLFHFFIYILQIFLIDILPFNIIIYSSKFYKIKIKKFQYLSSKINKFTQFFIKLYFDSYFSIKYFFILKYYKYINYFKIVLFSLLYSLLIVH